MGNELYKQLMARVGAEDSKYKIASDDRKKYPERIENFEHCHQIYKILERDTAVFDVEFAELASNEFIKITQQLNAVPVAVSKPEKQTKKKKKLTRNALKKQLTKQTKRGLYGEGRKNLFKLLTKFIEKHLKPMHELPMHQVFVYSDADKFCLDMFPFTNRQIRKRYEDHLPYFGDASDVEPESMSSMYSVYDCMGLYVNLFDAYEAFKGRFTKFDDEDYDVKPNKKQSKKKKKGKKSKKEEMSTDDDDDGSGEKIVTHREKMNQIEFRMAIDDLRFCGFVKATNRKQETLMKTADLL